MLVRDAMSAPVVTVAGDATLDDAVRRMLDERVGSVVVTGGGDTPASTRATGIVTATDVLVAGADSGKPFSALPVTDVASTPLVTVAPDRTVRYAVDLLCEEGIKHLPVVDGLDPVGIVTFTDVAVRYDRIREEAMELAERPESWD